MTIDSYSDSSVGVSIISGNEDDMAGSVGDPSFQIAQAAVDPVPVDVGEEETVEAVVQFPERVAADGDNVVHLPQGVSIDDVRVAGNDLVLVQPDGSTITVVDAALNIPTFVIGDVEIGPEVLVAALEAAGIDVAAGPDGTFSVAGSGPDSGGGDFSFLNADIGNAGPPIDLLPPTALAFGALDDPDLVPAPVVGPTVSGALPTFMVWESALDLTRDTGSSPSDLAAGLVAGTAPNSSDETRDNGSLVGSVTFTAGSSAINSIRFADPALLGNEVVVRDEAGNGIPVFWQLSPDGTRLEGFLDSSLVSTSLAIVLQVSASPYAGGPGDPDIPAIWAGPSASVTPFVTVTLVQNLLHSDDGESGADDLITLEGFRLVATDANNLSVATDPFSVEVTDDAPEVLANDNNTVKRDWTLDDDQQANGNDKFDNPADLNDYDAITGAPLGVLWGADGPGALVFQTTQSGAPLITIKDHDGAPLAGPLTSGGVPLLYVIVDNADGGQTLSAFAGNDLVFTFTLDPDSSPTGHFDLEFSKPLDHPAGNGEAPLQLDFAFTATDGDKDPASGSITIRIVDDVPVIETAGLTSFTVVHDETPGAQGGAADDLGGLVPNALALALFLPVPNKGNDPQTLGLPLGFARSDGAVVSADVKYGADGQGAPVSYSFALGASGVFSGLKTTEGGKIYLFQEQHNGVDYVVGRVGGDADSDPSGAAAFALHISGAGVVTMAQWLSIFNTNADPSSHNEIDTLAPNSLSVEVTVQDGDGDTSSTQVDISGQIGFRDDGPQATNVVGRPGFRVDSLDDESIQGLASQGINGGPADDGNGAQLSGLLVFNAGVDGLKTIAVSEKVQVSNSNGGANGPLKAIWQDVQGVGHQRDVNVEWTQNSGNAGGVLKGTAMDPNGVEFAVFTLTVSPLGAYTLVMHAPLVHPFTDEDGQNDGPETSWEDNLRLVFEYTVTDGDNDTATATLTVNVDDDSPEFIGDGIENGEATTLDLAVDGKLNLAFGADGQHATDGVRITGWPKELPGITTTLSADGKLLTATIDASGKPLYTLALNDDGTYTFTQDNPFPGGVSLLPTVTFGAFGPVASKDYDGFTLHGLSGQLNGSGQGFGIGSANFDGGESFAVQFDNQMTTATLGIRYGGSGTSVVTWKAINTATGEFETGTASFSASGNLVIDVAANTAKAGETDIASFDRIELSAAAPNSAHLIIQSITGTSPGAIPLESLTFQVTGKDGDGDAVSDTFKIDLKIPPATPVLAIDDTKDGVVHDESANLQAGDGDVSGGALYDGVKAISSLFAGIADAEVGFETHIPSADLDDSDTGQPAIGYARSLFVTAGAPGPDVVSRVFSLAIPDDGTASGLSTTEGVSVFLFEGPDGTIVGRAGATAVEAESGDIIFAIAINPANGEIFVVQYQSLSHGNDGDPDDREALGDAALQVVVTDTNGSNISSSASADIGKYIAFDDDGPVASATVAVDQADAPVVLDDDNQSNGNNGGPGDDAPGGKTVSGTLSFVSGADGVRSIAFVDADGDPAVTGTVSNGPDSQSHGLAVIHVDGGKGTPETVTLKWLPDVDAAGNALAGGGTLIGTSAHYPEATPAFTLQVGPDGAYTLTLNAPLAHFYTGDGDAHTASFEDNLTLDFAYTVTDGDGDTSSSTLTVTVDDDSPEFTGTGIADGVVTALDAAVIGNLNLAFGADGQNATDGLRITDWPKELPGITTTLSPDGKLLKATIGDADGPTLYTLALNDDGTYTFTQKNPFLGGVGIVPTVNVGTGYGPTAVRDYGSFKLEGIGGGLLNGSGSGVGINDNNMDPGDKFRIVFDDEMTGTTLGIKSQGNGTVSLDWVALDEFGNAISGATGNTGSIDGNSVTITPAVPFFQLAITVVPETGSSPKFKLTSVGGTSQDTIPLESLTFQVTGKDGDGDAVADTFTIGTMSNNAPTTSPVEFAAIAEDSGARTITQAQLLAEAVDPDGDSLEAINLQISSGNGNLTDNGDGTWTYTPALDDDTGVTFSYKITDGLNPPVATTATLDITPVNDAPAGKDGGIKVDESGTYTFDLTDFIFTDPNDAPNPDDFLSVIIKTLPTEGELLLDGVPVSADDEISVDYIDGGKLTYKPAGDGSDASGSFTFQVRDDGGTTNGGADTSVVYTMSISVDYGVEITGIAAPGSADDGTFVDEKGLPDGTGERADDIPDNDPSEQTSGSFRISAPNGLEKIGIGSKTFDAAELATASDTNRLEVQGTRGTLYITGYTAGIVTYIYVLASSVAHAGDAFEEFDVLAYDLDGDFSSTATLKIEIGDDAPDASVAADGVVANAELTYTGKLVEFGADGFKAFNVDNIDALNAANPDLHFSFDAALNTITAQHGDAGGDVFFTVKLKSDGTYDFELVTPRAAVSGQDASIGSGDFAAGGPTDTISFGGEGVTFSRLSDDPLDPFAGGFGVAGGAGGGDRITNGEGFLVSFDSAMNSATLNLNVQVTGNGDNRRELTVYWKAYHSSDPGTAATGNTGQDYWGSGNGGAAGNNTGSKSLLIDPSTLSSFDTIEITVTASDHSSHYRYMTVTGLSGEAANVPVADESITFQISAVDGDDDETPFDLSFKLLGDGTTLGGTVANEVIAGDPAKAETLVGGDGADTFVLNSLAIADLILDFDGGEGDAIDLTALFDIQSGGDLGDYVQYDATTGKLSVDADGGDGVHGFEVVATLDGTPAAGTINILYNDDGDTATTIL